MGCRMSLSCHSTSHTIIPFTDWHKLTDWHKWDIGVWGNRKWGGEVTLNLLFRLLRSSIISIFYLSSFLQNNLKYLSSILRLPYSDKLFCMYKKIFVTYWGLAYRLRTLNPLVFLPLDMIITLDSTLSQIYQTGSF